MIEATLCFLIDRGRLDRVLLGRKKAGFGAGKYGGFGGKVEAGETVSMTAVREFQEEAGITIRETDLHPAGRLTFLFPFRPAWEMSVAVFWATAWQGEPQESDEMIPSWFAIDQIPFDQMWDDVIHWLPHVLDGKRIRARFVYNPDNETVGESQITFLTERNGSHR